MGKYRSAAFKGSLDKVEDKKKICEMLLPVLQETRGFKDLISLKYE